MLTRLFLQVFGKPLMAQAVIRNKLAGMIAAVTISDEMAARVATAGLLLVRLDIES